MPSCWTLVLGSGDGLNITQAFRADIRTALIPIVALTTARPGYVSAVAPKVACTDFLSKPRLLSDVADLYGGQSRVGRPPESSTEVPYHFDPASQRVAGLHWS